MVRGIPWAFMLRHCAVNVREHCQCKWARQVSQGKAGAMLEDLCNSTQMSL